MRFVEKKATTHSLKMRKPLHGVGTNDADYMVKVKIEGKGYTCPYYRTWQNMITRCYYKPYAEERPTYEEAKVCNDWLLFSNFKGWMEYQDWENKALDKDILVLNNKIYSAKTCLFVSQKINSLLNKHEKSRGDYPQGVYYNKDIKKFHAQCSVDGKKKHVGFFDTVSRAEDEYIKFKANVIKQIALLQTDKILKLALLNQAKCLVGGVS